MRFFPHTADDVAAMLAAVGVSHIDELFNQVPSELRKRARIDLPDGQTEAEIRAYFEERANRTFARLDRCFAGAGAYPHFVPAVVDHILQRAEFYSAYTPYQPEVSQGTLQATFEFQTLVSMLFNLDVANASMYDGASATAEATLMALRLRPQRDWVFVSRALHPEYRATVRTYLGDAFRVVEVPTSSTGRTDLEWLVEHWNDRAAAVLVGYPNFFGVVEELEPMVRFAHEREALVITATAEPLALALLKPPGDFGVDIAVGEGQSFGIPLSYGGPGLGLFATKQQFVRMMPGRLVGEAYDAAGRRGFVLTLATREQHIRRERATSNICTNHGLMTLAFTAYASLLGKQGLRDLATTNAARARQLQRQLLDGGWTAAFSGPFFNEFTLRHPQARDRWRAALGQKLLPGVWLGSWYEEHRDALLLCVTEVASEEACEELVRSLTDGGR